jgi:predicted ribosome quality control (RQC) complex YloA/Tae2 family protein
MMNFIVKTHKKNTIYNKPHLFLLNKGMNSGKPQKEAFTNSFVVIFDNEKDCENMFWITYSLWKSKFWHRNLIGSVIPFLRKVDFIKEFSAKANEMLQDYEQHQKDVEALRLLELKENQFHQNINLINDLRRVILYRYCK